MQPPPVPLTLPPNVTTSGEPSVMVEVLPAGITVHDIRTVVTASGIDDDSDSSKFGLLFLISEQMSCGKTKTKKNTLRTAKMFS